MAVVGFAITSSAQCGSQATLLSTECGNWCVTVEIPLTGYLSVDSANLTATGGTMRRKPTMNELLMVADELC
jgi:hypothetical protein